MRSQLLPLLEERKLRVAVDFHAPLGVPKSPSASKQCRPVVTTPVLTEAYLASGTGEFENLVCSAPGHQQGAYRLIPLMAQQCTAAAGAAHVPNPGIYRTQMNWSGIWSGWWGSAAATTAQARGVGWVTGGVKL